jgi:hypothetical protein
LQIPPPVSEKETKPWARKPRQPAKGIPARKHRRRGHRGRRRRSRVLPEFFLSFVVANASGSSDFAKLPSTSCVLAIVPEVVSYAHIEDASGPLVAAIAVTAAAAEIAVATAGAGSSPEFFLSVVVADASGSSDLAMPPSTSCVLAIVPEVVSYTHIKDASGSLVTAITVVVAAAAIAVATTAAIAVATAGAGSDPLVVPAVYSRTIAFSLTAEGCAFSFSFSFSFPFSFSFASSGYSRAVAGCPNAVVPEG